jgi:hypothetical protein
MIERRIEYNKTENGCDGIDIEITEEKLVVLKVYSKRKVDDCGHLSDIQYHWGDKITVPIKVFNKIVESVEEMRNG